MIIVQKEEEEMEPTKSKSSSASSVKKTKKTEKRDVAAEESAHEESDVQVKDKRKKKKSTAVPKDTAASSSSSSSQVDQADANSPSMAIDEPNESPRSSTTVTSTSSTSSTTTTSNVTKTPQHNGSISHNISTPIQTPSFQKLLSMTTPLASPGGRSSTAARLKEREDLIQLNSRLRDLLASSEQKDNEIRRLRDEYITTSRQSTDQISNLEKKLEDIEARLGNESKLTVELSSQLQLAHQDARSKEQGHQAEIQNFQNKMDETIKKITEENSQLVVALRNDNSKKVMEIESLKSDVRQLQAELLTRSKEAEEKAHRILESEYNRTKLKEEELRNHINQKDAEIKKLKTELKEKEKLQVEYSRKESQLQQTIEGYERQAEDMRDSVNREWEIKCVQLVEEQNAKITQLEISANSFEDEKEIYKSQLQVYQGQIDDLNIKNHEFEDRIISLQKDLDTKDDTISQLAKEIDEVKKAARKVQADSKKKDIAIAMLQDEINGKDVKCNSLQSEMGKLRKELIMFTNASPEQDIPLTREIEQLKSLVNNFERRVKRKREEDEDEESNQDEQMNGGQQQQQNQQHQQQHDQQQKQQSEDFQVNTISLLSIDAISECIRLTVSGDFEDGVSISGYKIVVTKPDSSRIGFSFPENIVPFKGLNIINLFTGKTRPGTTPPNEFYWSRPNIWESPEGTIVKLLTPTDEVLANVTLPSNGLYHKDDKQSNCLIM
ncbi:hypothetical protein DFA_11046 [Cavenderia fasciculata]|uniref:LTD domain-containing protein n=1 Tax=Cavenderia fasciculata TaxID=261658 RepID=F4QEH2_CACFS|nr:uncharacterized protein DFA_11046 [Cavenderia fasciculata]EGG13285.1 hypothetical protein DFA_11046 [Cavenderia fasciculata]|eukprot:XP_004349984.1 hypothetical protein DFA_11046 [Cavenderia fasciculata]